MAKLTLSNFLWCIKDYYLFGNMWFSLVCLECCTSKGRRLILETLVFLYSLLKMDQENLGCIVNLLKEK